MSIIIDQKFKDKKGRWICHLTSDIPGTPGERELRAFAKQIGLYSSWIQFPGTYKIHFDLIGIKFINKAQHAGANRLTKKEFQAILKAKKEEMKIEQRKKR